MEDREDNEKPSPREETEQDRQRYRLIEYACQTLPYPLTGFSLGYIGNCDAHHDDRLHMFWFYGATVIDTHGGRRNRITSLGHTEINPVLDPQGYEAYMRRAVDTVAEGIRSGRYHVQRRTFSGRLWEEQDDWQVRYWKERYGSVERPALTQEGK